jgi:integrase
MGRKKRDGTPSKAANQRRLSAGYVKEVKPDAKPFCAWDTDAKGLVLKVLPTGHRSFFYVYRDKSRRVRWHHINVAGLSDAREIAINLRSDVAKGKDPAAEKKANRNAGTFSELCSRYLKEKAQKKNKSWRQADALVRRFLLPAWGNLPAKAILRADVRAVFGGIDAPILANQVLAAASAIFRWGITQDLLDANPCYGIERNETTDCDRVLSDGEIALLWRAFGSAGEAGVALKCVLLTGQRPGEIAHMHRSHLRGGWWQMPGAEVPELNWWGTKNKKDHYVFLSEPVRALIGSGDAGSVFGGLRLNRVMREMCEDLGVADPRPTPHDLRRTFKTTLVSLGRELAHLGVDLDRLGGKILNHKERGVSPIYNRYKYATELAEAMEKTAARILELAEGRRGAVVRGPWPREKS